MSFSLPVLILIAYVGGIVSICSPCSGLMIPMFFANTFSKSEKLLKHTLFFSLGALAFSVPLGLVFSYIFLALNTNYSFVFKILGALFILLGLLIFLGFGHILSLKLNYKASSSFKSSFLLGVVAALTVGTCSGPILGLILTVAGTTGYIVSTTLMFFYVLGLITPLFLIVFGVEKLSFLKRVLVKGKSFKVFNLTIHSTNIVSGVLFIAIGVIFLLLNGSALGVFNHFRFNYDFMLGLQDQIISLFLN